MEDPKLRILLSLKKELEDYLEEMRKLTNRLEGYLQNLDTIIGESSFSTADAALGITPPPEELETEVEETPSTDEYPLTVVVMNKARDLELATITVSELDLLIVPADHAIYDIKLGAFARFFVERILGGFQKEDRHRVENGEIEWEEAFDFEVRADDSILQEIVIRNYSTQARLQEIQRTLRWALEKTYVAR